jgi:hypothetical protein
MTIHKRAKSEDAINSVCKQRVQAITAYTTGKPGITILATLYSWAQLGGIYQKCIDTRTALAAARAQEQAAQATRDAADADRKKVDEDVLRWAVNTFGEDSPEAIAFGYVKPVVTPPTAAVKAAAVAKAKATKLARGEVGKKARAAIQAPAAEPPAGNGGTGTPTKA